MSNNINSELERIDAESSTDKDRADRLSSLVLSLSAELDEMREQMAEYDETLSAHTNRMDALFEAVTENSEEIFEASLAREENLSEVRRRISSLEEGDRLGAPAELSPIERHNLWGSEQSGLKETKNLERALLILKHFGEWSRDVGGERILINRDAKLREKLSMVQSHEEFDRKYHYSEIDRACDALADASNNKIEYVNDDKHGNMLVMKSGASLYLSESALVEAGLVDSPSQLPSSNE